MVESKSEDLAKKVNVILKESSRISKESKDIEVRKDNLKSDERNLYDRVEHVRNLMENGLQLENRFLDYAVYHYDSRAEGEVKSIEDFFEDFSKYSGQLILENCAGHNWARTMEKGYVERKIFLGRLKKDTCYIEMPARLAKAKTDNLKIFRCGEGWKGSKNNLLLNDFIYKIDNLNPSVQKLFENLWGRIVGKDIPKGIYREIFSPIQTERSFGGSVIHDSEPHRSLIVGDEAVNHYLKKQNLEIVTRSTSPVEIPKI